MASNANGGTAGVRVPWRFLGWGGAVALLLLPLIAMQFTHEVNWTLSDFIFAGVIFAIVGGTFELAVRASGNWAYRAAVALALAGGFFTVWINLAVGIVGNEDNPINLVFFVTILIAVAGSISARFAAEGMKRAMAVTGIFQALVGLFIFFADIGSGDPPGAIKLLILILALAGFWLASALLFRKAAA
jgi:hypothetical protein